MTDHRADHRPLGFDERFDFLAAIAYRVAFRILGDRSDAQDVAQESLARALLRFDRIEAHAEAWVARVAANQAIGLWRKRHRSTRPVGAAILSYETSVVDRMELIDAMRSLPRRQREVVVLRFLADLPEAMVADVLGLRPGSVKQHTHRGLAALRALLTSPDGEVADVRTL